MRIIVLPRNFAGTKKDVGRLMRQYGADVALQSLLTDEWDVHMNVVAADRWTRNSTTVWPRDRSEYIYLARGEEEDVLGHLAAADIPIDNLVRI